jgi:uncharacterized membrane protein
MATKEEKDKRNQEQAQFNNSAARALSGEKTNNPYDVSTVKFPSDLATSPDLLHYVMFAINVRGKSNFNYKKTGIKVAPESGAKLSPEELEKVKYAGTAAAGVGAAVTVTALADTIKKKFNVSGAVSKKVLDFSGPAAGLATTGAMLSSDILSSDQSSRIADVIALHVDGPPTVKYSAQYSNKDLGTMAGLLSGSAFNSVQGGLEAGAAIGMQFAKLPGALGGGDLSAAIGSSAKVALNAFKEVIFEAVDFRSFAFKYKFLPKNKKESDSVKKIINLFKFHMHPEVSQTKLFFIYPSEFQITYFYKGKTNEYFHKFRPCVLESMEVSYGGEQFSSFRDGQPTEVNMSLVFKETEILTKELIGANGVY